MNDSQLKNSLDLISAINHLPIFILSNSGQALFVANGDVFPSKLVNGFLKLADLKEAVKSERIYSVGEYEEYFVFQTSFNGQKNCYCVIGPAFLGKPNDDIGVSSLSFYSEIGKYLVPSTISNIDVFTSTTFAQLVSLIRLLSNGEHIPPQKILASSAKNLAPTFQDIQQTLTSRFSGGKQKYTYDQELAGLAAVRDGRTLEAAKMARLFNYARVGLLSTNPTKDTLYLCICLIALATRAAIQGGLNPALAYTMSDEYIQKCDLAKTSPEIVSISQTFIEEITKKVHDSKRKNMDYSETISRSIDFIQNNLASNLNMKKAAENSGFTYRYFSKLFKKEVKMNFSQFVTSQRIESAKNSLAFTKLPESEIAFSLGFASQSHFIKTFKKVTGMTPLAYREKAKREKH
jgi:AraC family transcriptional regulator